MKADENRADENRAWVKSVTDRIDRDDTGSMQNRFRLIVNTNFLNAIGKNSRFEGLTPAQVLDKSIAEVGTVGFIPKYDPALRSLDWPDRE
jgi:hypothetical protein